MSVISTGVRPRLIPTLLIRGNAVYTTRAFANPCYVGDLLNTVRIFNELEVDELMVLDIDASSEGRGPDMNLMQAVADECFMPLCYGGGVSSVEQMHALYKIGVEKVSLNSALYSDPELLERAAKRFGRQAVVASLDVARVRSDVRPTPSWSYSRRAKLEQLVHAPTALDAARSYAQLGAGELLLSSVSCDGTREGYDLALVAEVCGAVDIPVIANCGGGTLDDVQAALSAGAAAAAAGTMLVRQKALESVLIHYPNQRQRSLSIAPPSSWSQV